MLDTAKSRRLLSDLGSQHVDLFAFATSKGQVCTVFSKVYGSAGCFAAFSAATPVSYDIRDVDQVGAGLPAIVDGLVPNDVTSVGVEVAGVAHQAQLQNNAFFYELPTATDWPEALVITYTDGTSTRVPLSPRPAAN